MTALGMLMFFVGAIVLYRGGHCNPTFNPFLMNRVELMGAVTSVAGVVFVMLSAYLHIG